MSYFCKDCNDIKKTRAANYCKTCGYKHRKRPSGLTYKIKTKNKAWFKKGHKAWWKGKKRKEFVETSDEHSTMHKWIRRHWGKPKECNFCNSKKNLEWANKSGEYKKIRSDWLQLCKKCHHSYDYHNFGARKEFYEHSMHRE